MAMSDYHKKISSFEYDMIDHEKVNEMISAILVDGLLPYNDFTKVEWKNGDFYHFKNDLFEMWCTTYNGGRMSYLVKYFYHTHIIGDAKWSTDKVSIGYYNIPDFHEDMERETKNSDYYFDLIRDNINDSLTKSHAKNGRGKMPFRMEFDSVYVRDLFNGGELLGDKFFCDGITNDNFSEVNSTMNDLFMIKHYMDDED